MGWKDRIEINPLILSGKPLVRGTRLAVEFVVDLKANDWTDQQILENYPGVTLADISACLHDAAETLKSERVDLTATIDQRAETKHIA